MGQSTRPRICRHTSSPLRPFIIMSSKIRSKRPSSTRRSASSPERTAVTSSPFSSSTSETSKRMDTSSSTKRIFSCIPPRLLSL